MTRFGSFRISALLFFLFLSSHAFAIESQIDLDTKDVGVSIAILAEGKQSYLLPKEYEDQNVCLGELPERICKAKKSDCDEYIDYPQFEPAQGISADKVAGLASINTALKTIATSHRCSVHSRIIKLTPEEVYARLPIISVVMRTLDYCASCGGSCHGNHITMTFDAQTGKEIKLSDIMPVLSKKILSPLDFINFQDGVPRPPEERGYNLSEKDYAKAKAELAESLNKKFWSGGFFIRHGKVYANSNTFLYGCVNGNFYPFQIKDEYIKPEFLDLIQKSM